MRQIKNICTVVLFLISISAVGVEKLKFVEGGRSDVADKFISVLSSSTSREVATLMAYPDIFTVTELEKEQLEVEGVLKIVRSYFGNFVLQEFSPENVKFYETGLSGGPMFWWTSDSDVITKRYVFSVKFTEYDDGYIILLSSYKSGVEKIVSLSYGLPEQKTESKTKIANVIHAILDSQGVPKDHPTRKHIIDEMQSSTTCINDTCPERH